MSWAEYQLQLSLWTTPPALHTLDLILLNNAFTVWGRRRVFGGCSTFARLCWNECESRACLCYRQLQGRFCHPGKFSLMVGSCYVMVWTLTSWPRSRIDVLLPLRSLCDSWSDPSVNDTGRFRLLFQTSPITPASVCFEDLGRPERRRL